MASACRKENSPGRGQSLFRWASRSGQTALHGCLVNRNHKYSWHREPQHGQGGVVHTVQDRKAQRLLSRAGCSFCSHGQAATRACTPTRDHTAFHLFLCARHTRAEETTGVVFVEWEGDPDFISHHSLFLVCWFTTFFSDQLFHSTLGPTLNPIYMGAS